MFGMQNLTKAMDIIVTYANSNLVDSSSDYEQSRGHFSRESNGNVLNAKY